MLVVEDDATSRKALRFLLTRRQYEVREAEDLRTANALLSHGTDILLLDLMLPDGSGVDLLRQIRARNLPIRVAVVTGANDQDLLSDVHQLKPDAFFRKPLQMAELDEWLAK